MLKISNTVFINENDLKFSFIRSSGPGGQNVNKVSTAVQLKVDINNIEGLSEDNKEKLIKICGKKITNDEILLIEAKRFRTQEKNKKDAIDRLISLVTKSLKKRKARKKTKPTSASKDKRIEAKKQRGKLKKQREKPKNLLE